MADVNVEGPGGITITYPDVTPGYEAIKNNSNNTVKLPDIAVSYPVLGPDSLFDNSNPNAGYTFWFSYKELHYVFPVTPPSVKITIGSKNETVDLINLSEINILKGPALVEIEFDARYPMREYPYSRGGGEEFFKQWSALKEAKEKKGVIDFGISRPTQAMKYHNGYKPGWNTQIKCAIEDIELNESYDEGDDVILTLRFRQWKNYGVVELQKSDDTTSSSTEERPTDDTKNGTTENQTHKTVAGDTLWGLAQKYYGDGSKYKTIYDANKDIIESTAKQYGRESSSNGNYIWPNTDLTIPKIN